MRDGAVVLEKVVVACLGGGGYLFYHRLLRKSILASPKGVNIGGTLLTRMSPRWSSGMSASFGPWNFGMTSYRRVLG